MVLNRGAAGVGSRRRQYATTSSRLRESTVAFFPLYGLHSHQVLFYLTRISCRAHRLNLSLVSLCSTLAIGRPVLRRGTVQRGLVLLTGVPTPFSSPFYASLFLRHHHRAFYLLPDERNLWCGIWGMLACLTRSSGVALFLAMARGYFWKSTRAPEAK